MSGVTDDGGLDVARLRELLAAATPRPWHDAPHGARHDCRCVKSGGAGRGRDHGEFVAMYVTRDAALIAAAVNALPELLAKAEAHDALVAAVRGVLDADQAWSGNPDEAGRLTRAIERLRDAYLATAALRAATEDAAAATRGESGQ